MKRIGTSPARRGPPRAKLAGADDVQPIAVKCEVQYAPGFCGNFSCGDMNGVSQGNPPNVTNYYTDVSWHINADNSVDLPISAVTFQNLTTLAYVYTTLISATFTVVDANHYTFDAIFSGGITSGGGSIHLELDKQISPYHHRVYWVTDQSSTVTLN